MKPRQVGWPVKSFSKYWKSSAILVLSAAAEMAIQQNGESYENWN